MEHNEELALWEERYELALERIRQVQEEGDDEPSLREYFCEVAAFLLQIAETRRLVADKAWASASKEELFAQNLRLYADVLPERYERSYANPQVAVDKLGAEFGRILSFLYTEMRSLIGFVYEEKLSELVIRMELFLEVYTTFLYEWKEEEKRPGYESVQQIIYWFVSDYADMAALARTRELVTPADRFAEQIIMRSDLQDPRYLFAYGEYISEAQWKMAEYMATLPEETIRTMADTYTEGYRMGFVTAGKDLSKKKVVDIRYQLGFERMIKYAIQNFEGMGLQPAIYRNPTSILYNPSIFKNGFFGGDANRQFVFDHKDDKGLFLDKNYMNRRLEVTHTAFEEYREQALGYAGPALVETFGEKEFEPINKPECISLSEEQNKLWVEYRGKAGQLQREYILEEERSFTIIAFPTPEIGEVFEELFRETIRINTLDYTYYQKLQQTLIDTLDRAEYCEIRGMNGNGTNLRVALHYLQDAGRETNFENCVADVNIPVGEVFTSPRLSGTNGVLHVKKVYLNGLEFRDLSITIKDGKTTDYSCKNFDTEEENRAFIQENILFRHPWLPMGEFAIGTNTTAYVIAKRLQVDDKMPILIAEKMGPHFAFGDTCYSHGEEIRVYNPDGKEIVAKDNEISILRDTAPRDAYFNCHTDITIPYDELLSLNAVTPQGEVIPIICEGRFVLPGLEGLNEPFDDTMAKCTKKAL